MSDANDRAAEAPNSNNVHQNKRYDYGGNPLAKEDTSASMLPAFGGNFQPGLYKAVKETKLANAAPMGLSGFALTTFLLSLINIGVRDTMTPNIVIGAAFGYGGLVQLLAGMWEMAAGNTFAATAFASYGGFWISFAIVFTPGGFQVESTYEEMAPATATSTTMKLQEFYTVFAFYLFGWFIFTFLMLMCTFKSTVAFFLLFLFLDLAFLMLAIGYLDRKMGEPNLKLVKAGGYFGIFAAFAAWYNALAGLLDRGNSFFLVPVAHFPWSEKGRESRGKLNKEDHQA